MDWLAERQERIENTLARRHQSSRAGSCSTTCPHSYVEGSCCRWRRSGTTATASRQTADQLGACVLASRAAGSGASTPGNTADPTTVPGVIDTVKERFGIERVILVGDRAMITDAHAQTLKELGAGFVSALKSAQIRKLMKDGRSAAVTVRSDEPGRDHLDRVPLRAIGGVPQPAPRHRARRKREELLAATERELEKVKASVANPSGRLHQADAGQIGERVGRVINKYKVAKHFNLQIQDGSFSHERKTEQIIEEAALDGLYVLRTTCPTDQLTTQAVVRVYKQLKMAERAYRTIKDALDVRAIRPKPTPLA